jgi:hypothetical protein
VRGVTTGTAAMRRTICATLPRTARTIRGNAAGTRGRRGVVERGAGGGDGLVEHVGGLGHLGGPWVPKVVRDLLGHDGVPVPWPGIETDFATPATHGRTP